MGIVFVTWSVAVFLCKVRFPSHDGAPGGRSVDWNLLPALGRRVRSVDDDCVRG